MHLDGSTLAAGLRGAANGAWGMARHHHGSHAAGIGIAVGAFDAAVRTTDARVRSLAREAVGDVVRAQLTWGTTAIPHWYAAAGALQRSAEVQEAVAPSYGGRRHRDELVPADAKDAALHADGSRRPMWRSDQVFDAMADCARHAATLAAASDGVGARSHAMRAARVGIATLSPQFNGAASRAALEGILALFDASTGRVESAVAQLTRAADAFAQVVVARRTASST